MTVHDLLAITPRQLAALGEARRTTIKEERDWQDALMQRSDNLLQVMLGQQIAMVANTGFKGWKEPRTPQEFMPGEWAKTLKQKRGRMTKTAHEQRESSFRIVFETFRGLAKRKS